MRLRQLFESSDRSVGIIFGRFNPPHQGHKAAWEMAAHNDYWFVGTNKSTEGPKDPLPYAVKTKAMLAVMPEIKGHIVPETSWLTLASKVYKEYGDITLNVYTDEDWVTKTLIQYNGVEGPHGIYNFKHIDQKPTPRLSSATALRNAVQAGDRDAFAKAAGVDANTAVGGKPFFDVVAHYLAPYAAKLAAKPVKKKVKQPEQEVAEGDDPCWDNYKQIGMKKKGGKSVPNCVPKESTSNAMANLSKRLTDPNDGKTAKLRAAGDKRRDSQYMSTQIAKNDRTSKDDWGDFKKNLAELSSDMLGRYKKAAGADASKADKEGNVEKGNKRFKGIVKATNKQFDNDMKGKK
jgi:hypothetical protein